MEMVLFWANILLGLLLSGICVRQSLALPPHHSQYASLQRPQHTQRTTTEEPPKALEQVNTISVACYPDLLEIAIKADLFAVGAPVNSNEIRLGVDEDDYYCRATVSSEDEYKIVAGLMDCGTKHWMTEDSLVYTNLLIYSPIPSPNGVIRMDEAVIPIECHYARKYSLSSSSLMPSWVSFTSTMSAVENLDFNLKLMTGDWQYERGSQVYYLGDPINIEASVRVGHHMKLRVFLSSCVATLHPDMDSEPRYVLIEDGCLVDSAVPGSKSHFLVRTQENSLQMVIDAFKFHNDNRGEIYVTCHVNAVPLDDAEAPNKACTLVNGRWRSADGNDYLCGYCQSQNEVGETHSKLGSTSRFGPRGFGKPVELESSWRSGLRTNKVWEQEARLGPMTILPRTKSAFLPLDEVPPVLAKLNRPSFYGSQWRSGNGKLALEDEILTGPPAHLDVETEGEMDEELSSETEDEDMSTETASPDFKVKSLANTTTTEAPSEPTSTPEAEEETTVTNATAAQSDPKK
ncbi:zona pellucida sperm-binding protein 3-like [Salarias fasciatus]|uniref:zona pellucida sperm-binding protein 3-like n=1 Tax=Salarias fasciatus TaxID=181472 RepID=UPI00117687A6|nr:zona pellucida sperm-binding protein 3-like [Salarias fasciatus]